jgi:hypothetical protein
MKASGNPCNFCREKFFAGVEAYGGLGDRHHFGLRNTSHYLAPVVSWSLASGWTFRFSQGFGLNDNSRRVLTRWGVSREFSGFGEALSRAFRYFVTAAAIIVTTFFNQSLEKLWLGSLCIDF